MTRSELPFTFLEDGPIFNLYGNSDIGAYIGEIMERDYAAFIVKACNAHDELVEVLTALGAWVRHWQDDVAGNLKPTPGNLSEARDRITAALAKVQSGNHISEADASQNDMARR